MTVKDLILKEKEAKKIQKYELVAPEGGWGYIVTIAVAVAFIVTIVPLCGFGLVYGNFLADIGDETGGTTLANGVFNTVLSFTGLAANQMLQKYTYRRVAVIGSLIYFIGGFAAIFVQSLEHLILTFGILQGFGFGLLMPSAFTAFNLYFDKRKNLMMSICQALMVAATIGWPVFTKILVDNYGFRGTVAVYAALSLHALLAMITLQPIEWHLVKKEILDVELQKMDDNEKNNQNSSDVLPNKKEGEPLLFEKMKQISSSIHDIQRHGSRKSRPSIVSLGSMALSMSNIHKIGKVESEKKLSFWEHVSQTLDLGLFKDMKYVNIAFGLSLSLTSDMSFMSILPLLLTEFGFDGTQITQILTIYFTADLICRILLSVANVFWLLRNRYLFLAGSLLSAAFRIGFVCNTSYSWIVTMSASLGFLRCLIQTPLPLVVAEEYPERFTTAFSLYMVVCGVVSLVFGLLLGVVKNLTSSNIMVVHMLTLAYLLCGIPWVLEIIGSKVRGKREINK